jgi:hypothetical protein
MRQDVPEAVEVQIEAATGREVLAEAHQRALARVGGHHTQAGLIGGQQGEADAVLLDGLQEEAAVASDSGLLRACARV